MKKVWMVIQRDFSEDGVYSSVLGVFDNEDAAARRLHEAFLQGCENYRIDHGEGSYRAQERSHESACIIMNDRTDDTDFFIMPLEMNKTIRAMIV